MASAFPKKSIDRDRWILDLRPVREKVQADVPYLYFWEEECGAAGQPEPVATLFLSNRECPFRCTMCDLWKHTRLEPTPAGAIPAQIDYALKSLGPARTVKLYNSGSFFDPRAIPQADHAAIAVRLSDYDRVIVESHPAFVGMECVAFRDQLAGRLEVAMGLETAHPQVLEKLNKQMTLDQYAAAADFLSRHDIDLRAFILVQPPFMRTEESLHWAERSLEFAFECGATAATLIPTRGGNGAMEVLAAANEFSPPRLRVLEDASAHGLDLRHGRVFADLWGIEQRDECGSCFPARVERLARMNLWQSLNRATVCRDCGSSPGGNVEGAL